MREIDQVYHKKLQCTKEDLFEACNGFVTEHSIYLLQMVQDNIATTQQSIEKLNQRIKTLLLPYENVLELLKGVPGLNTKTVEDLVAEIGLNMDVFLRKSTWLRGQEYALAIMKVQAKKVDE